MTCTGLSIVQSVYTGKPLRIPMRSACSCSCRGCLGARAPMIQSRSYHRRQQIPVVLSPKRHSRQHSPSAAFAAPTPSGSAAAAPPTVQSSPCGGRMPAASAAATPAVTTTPEAARPAFLTWRARCSSGGRPSDCGADPCGSPSRAARLSARRPLDRLSADRSADSYGRKARAMCLLCRQICFEGVEIVKGGCMQRHMLQAHCHCWLSKLDVRYRSAM